MTTVASNRLPLPTNNGGAKTWTKFVSHQLERGDTLYVDSLAQEMYGVSDFLNRGRVFSFVSSLREKLEHKGATLICRDGVIQLIKEADSILEKEEVVLRSIRVKRAARSHARVSKNFVLHNPDQKSFARKIITDVDRELKILNAKMLQADGLLLDSKNALSEKPTHMPAFAAKSKRAK